MYLMTTTLFGIALLNYAVSQDENIPTFMKRVENCSGFVSDENIIDEKESKRNLDISYLLYTRRNPQNEYIMKPNRKSVLSSMFNPCVGTLFIVHGFGTRAPKSSAFYGIKDELLKQGDYNVVVMDWTKYNLRLYLIEVIKIVPMAASDLAEMIKVLMDVTGIKSESVYLVGHSLGVELVGLAAKKIPNIGRVTGLDAASPYYRFFPESMRLSYTDAIFVDGIHTNGAPSILKGIGILEPYGHQDYFPNGGSKQTGCNNPLGNHLGSNLVDWVTDVCSHNIALDLYLNSINNCEFLSVLCGSYEDFNEHKCSPETTVTSRMGFHAKKINNLPEKSTFFLRTGEKPNFCT